MYKHLISASIVSTCLYLPDGMQSYMIHKPHSVLFYCKYMKTIFCATFRICEHHEKVKFINLIVKHTMSIFVDSVGGLI